MTSPTGVACLPDVPQTGDGSVCIDIDECMYGTDSCGSGSTCWNTYGSFQCVCSFGYELVPVRTTSGNATVVEYVCRDIDECVDLSDAPAADTLSGDNTASTNDNNNDTNTRNSTSNQTVNPGQSVPRDDLSRAGVQRQGGEMHALCSGCEFVGDVEYLNTFSKTLQDCLDSCLSSPKCGAINFEGPVEYVRYVLLHVCVCVCVCFCLYV